MSNKRYTENKKIRTLKELDFMDMASGDGACFVNEDSVKGVLREQAKKQLKYCNECMDGKHKKDSSLEFQAIYHARTWIKRFFDITEEDLK